MFDMENANALVIEYIKLDGAFHHRNEYEYNEAKEMIRKKYIDLKRELAEMKKTVSELKGENQQLQEAARALHLPPATLQIDDAALYGDWQQTTAILRWNLFFNVNSSL